MIKEEQQEEAMEVITTNPSKAIEILFDCKYGLWDKQKQIVDSVLVKKNRKTAVRSCHDSGKTFIDARIALLYLIANQDSLVITTAPSWMQVKEILWREMSSAYNSCMMNIGGSLSTTKLDFGDDWFAIGLSTRKEGDATDVAERMLGFHSKTGKILIVVDEGSGVKEPIWNAIDGLMTSDKAQLLVSGNPYRTTGTFAKLFKESRVQKIHIEDKDIPNIKENKIIIPGLMSPRYPDEMAAKYGKDSNLYLVKVKGKFPRSESDALIPIDDVEAAFLRTQEPTGVKRLGIDVARYGNNFSVFLVRQGKKVIRKEKHPKKSTMETVAIGLRIMEEEGIEARDVDIDDIGVGGGVVDRFREKGYNVNGVNVGSVADDEDHFYNIRAENAWAIRTWIKTADISKDDDYYELANIKYKWRSDRKGQLQLESKENMVKRGLESPDTFDALGLTFTGSTPAPFPKQTSVQDDKSSRPITGGLIDREF